MHFTVDKQNKLITAAQDACAHSYSPYSGLQVGAALLTTDGKIFSGTNIENASYSATICAERAALASAVSGGHRAFIALALTFRGSGISPDKVLPPCGVCRQSLAEFSEISGHDIDIIMVSADRSKKVVQPLSTLLPLVMELKKA